MSFRTPLGATPETGAFELGARPVDARRGHARARAAEAAGAGRLGLLGVLVTGLVLTMAASHTSSLLPESVRPVPTWLAGPFGGTDFGLGVPALLILLSVMFASYAVVARNTGRLSGRAVLMSIAALHALVLLAPPLLSTDIFSYQAYARMGSLYGASPYLQGPHAIAFDPIYPFIGAKWVTTPSAYGPLFTLVSYVLAPLSIAASALAYKAVATVSSLALVALVWNSARLRGLNPVRSAALVGLNPLIVLYGVGGGHNDLLMLALVAGGIYLMLGHRDRAAGASIALALGIKLTAGLFGAFALAGGARAGLRTPPRRRSVMVGAAVAIALLTAIGLIFFGSGALNMVATVQKGQSEGDWHSIAGFITTKLGLVTAGHAVAWALAGVFAATTAWLLRRVWRGQLDWIDGAGWATALLLVCASALFPWYVAWLIPLAALASDRRLWRVAIVLTGIVQVIQMLGYVPH